MTFRKSKWSNDSSDLLTSHFNAMLAHHTQDVLHPYAGLLLTYERSSIDVGTTLDGDDDNERHPALDLVTDIEMAIKPSPQSTTMCPICLDPVVPNPSSPAADAAGVSTTMTEPTSYELSCSHVYCYHCIKTYVAKKVDDRKVDADQLTCPMVECRSAISVVNILQTTTEATFLKYMRFVQQNQFERMPHGRWCPSASCDAMVDCNPKIATFQCSFCKTKGCFKCGNLSHPFRTCHQAMDAQYRDWEARQRRTSNPVKACPSCGVRIWKLDGCAHMTCSKCRHEWCWVCHFRWSAHNKRVCDVVHAWESPYWGPSWPVRFVTKMVVAPCALAVGAVGGLLFGLGLALYGLVIALPKHVYKQLKWQTRRHRAKPSVLSTEFIEQFQQGVHVYIHQEDHVDENDPNHNDWLQGLANGIGRWRNRREDQYVQYAQSVIAGVGGFVSYLSTSATRRTSLDGTPNAITVVVLHGTTTLPHDDVLRALVAVPYVAEVFLVINAQPETVWTAEVAHALTALQRIRPHAHLLAVPNDHPEFNQAYLNAIYTALGHFFLPRRAMAAGLTAPPFATV
ncbi:hypothetical protein, variant 1 [Aphanomyces astaci]|uniref:RBR-type E3 ubiquitin transferase n=1 Tax=Aphanomyces astaci TaxID=112090 RepID=W4GZE9_APHAT|nr:hypothetical protein, variant 1 [Aphanomyces astaci]ETV85027.1 hypothetical protein, variant 1 [Aphanomyces astaci]|eukprot:XP_009825045.1 hypothetical protein, variant 1 [Aphanomyces astaci]